MIVQEIFADERIGCFELRLVSSSTSTRYWKVKTPARRRAGLCNLPEDYYYSSAKFYCDGTIDLEC